MWDLLIRGGTVVDGTGAPPVRADVAVRDGTVVAVAPDLPRDAAQTIDAGGLAVTPGFVDPHTHYDAQICWDPLLSCSSWHGVTTAVMGNCGVGVAPCRPEDREALTWDLVNLEAIPYEALAQGLTWDWESFPDYLAALERRGSGINLACLVPLAPLRRHVMGAAAIDRAADADETGRIAALLAEAMAAGAAGFSTTNAPAHIGHLGRPMSCVAASADELAAYARVLKAAGRGAIEIAIKSAAAGIADDDYALLDRLLAEGTGAVTFLAIIKQFDRPTAHLETVERVAPLLARGARPQLHSTDLYSDLNLANPYMLSAFPSWHGLFNRPLEEQRRIYADPAFRARWREELVGSRAFHGDFSKVWIANAARPDWRALIGRDVAELAAERGQDPLDAFFDMALEDGLRLDYTTVRFGVPEEFLGDPRTLIGLSDGGAHVGILCNAGYTTETLGKLVRERGLLSLELAVKRMTSEPADFFGLKDRGRLQPGLAADIAVFDPATVGSDSARPEPLDDLPGGGRRLVVRPTGMRWVIVNGQVLLQDGRHPGGLPGQLLRPRPT